MCGPQCQCTFVIAVRYGIQCGFTQVNNSRQDHDAQQYRCSQHADTRTARNHPCQRYHHYQSEKAVNNRRDTCHQLNQGFQHTMQLLRAEPGQEYCCQQSDRHTDDNRSDGDTQATNNHRQNAIGCRFIFRCPAGSQQELYKTDFLHCRHTVGKQEKANQDNCYNRHTRTQCKQP